MSTNARKYREFESEKLVKIPHLQEILLHPQVENVQDKNTVLNFPFKKFQEFEFIFSEKSKQKETGKIAFDKERRYSFEEKNPYNLAKRKKSSESTVVICRAILRLINSLLFTFFILFS